MPLVLLAASPTDGDLAELATLQRDLAAAGRCAVAAVTTGSDRLPPAGWRVTVTSGGVLHVRLPFLHGCLSAAGLTSAELGDLSEELRHAREAAPVRVPAAVEPEAWAAGTDAAGAVLATDPDPDPDPEPDTDTEPGPVPDTEPGSDWPVATLPRRAGPPDDPDLDDDLRAWHADDPGRPRVSILGPVRVDSHGTAPETRVRLHRELVVYLAQRGDRGAGATQLDAALWPGTKISDTDRQLVIARARQWLGTDPGGNPWLSEPGPDLTYRLAPGYLLDWHLFRRLRTRGELRGDDGAGDLRAALHLVRGVPLDGADRPAGPGARNPYPWLGDSQIHPDLLMAAVVDTAHQLAELHIATGDTDAVRWAVRQGWLADPERTYDQPWRDLMRAEHTDGRHDQVRALVAELMEARDAEALEDLAPDTYHLIRTWSPLPKSWSFESPTRAPGVQDHELGGGGEADWSP
jgi:hypothetical protein